MQLPTLYRPILKRALGIVWKHKFLWFFGFFAALLGGSGEIDFLVGGMNNVSWGTLFGEIWSEIAQEGGLVEFLAGLLARLGTIPGTGIAVLAIFLFGFIILIWLFISSQITLINSTANDANRTNVTCLAGRQANNTNNGWGVVKKCFWRILGLFVISKIIIFGLFLVLGLASLTLTFGGEGLFEIGLLILFYIIILVLVIIVSFTARYAGCYVILNGEKIGQAIKNGLNLFFRNWLVSAEAAVVLFGLNVLVGVLMGLVGFLVAFPFMVGTEAFINMGNGSRAWTVMTAGSAVALIFLAILGAIFVSFTYGVWTLLFLRLNSSQRQLSRLVRWVAMIGR